MDAKVEVLDYVARADEELIVEQYDGRPSTRVLEVLSRQYDSELPTMGDAAEYLREKLDGGEWIIVVDGEVLELGHEPKRFKATLD